MDWKRIAALILLIALVYGALIFFTRQEQPAVPPIESGVPARTTAATSEGAVQQTPSQSPTAIKPLLDEVARLALAEASAFQRVGDYKAAIKGYSDLLSLAPSSPVAVEARFRIGESYLLDGDYPSAIAQLQELLALLPVEGLANRALFLLGTAHKELGDFERAAYYYRQYKPVSGIEPYVGLQVADSYAKAGRYNEAIGEAEKVLSAILLPIRWRVETMEVIAKAYTALRNHAEAASWYQRILDIATVADYRAEITYQLGQAWSNGGQKMQARDAWRELVERYPRSPAALPALEALLQLDGAGVSPYYKGLVYYFHRRYQEAIDALAEYVTGYPGGENLDTARYYLAMAYSNIGNLDWAAVLFERVVSTFPNSSWADDALWQLGRLREEVGNHLGAIQSYSRLAQTYPSSNLADDALFRQGLIRFKLGQYSSALQAWSQLVTTYPGSDLVGGAWFWTGRAYRELGQGAKAAEALGRAAPRAPWDYYGFRAKSLLEDKDALKPNHLGAIALEVEKGAFEGWLTQWAPPPVTDSAEDWATANGHYAMGKELLDIGMTGEAIAEFDQAIQELSQDPWSLYRLAEVFRGKGLYQQSMQAAWRLLSTSPTPSLFESPRLIQKLLYPTPYLDLVAGEAEKNGLDPLLFYALLRQESAFNPQALSVSGARGLAQVMPATGEGIAKALGKADFRLGDLLKPIVSIQFGAWYLGTRLQLTEDNPFFALAGYNGGLGNVQRWIGGDLNYDTDMFVEDIPFPETRLYVRLVYTYYQQYRLIYSP